MEGQRKKEITGSGILLWELYKCRQSGRVELAVVLFGSNRKSGFIYMDCGGGIDSGEAVQRGALRELQEETCNLFQLSQNHLTTSVQAQNYICYNVYINAPHGQFKMDLFKDNLHLLKEADSPHSWRETKSMRRFFIQDLIKMNIEKSQNYNFTAFTTRGESVAIHRRTVNIIREVLKKKLVNLAEQTISAPSIEISIQPYILPQGSRLTFLKGTKFFKIDNSYLDINNSQLYQKQLQQQFITEQQMKNNNQLQQNNQIQNNSQFNNNEMMMIEESNLQKPFVDMLQNYNITNQNLITKIKDPKTNRRGGGVLVLATSSESGEQGFLLVKDRKDICSDMGGSSSSHELNIMEAGIRELKEETSNTFNLCEIHLNNSHSIRIQNYLCHAVHFEVNIAVLQNVFLQNVSTLVNFGEAVPRCWRGKKEILFFPLSKNKAILEQFDINADQYYLIDSNDTKQVIRDRSAIIIHSMISQNMHLRLPKQKVVLEDNSSNEFTYNDSFKFLCHTQSYVFQ